MLWQVLHIFATPSKGPYVGALVHTPYMLFRSLIPLELLAPPPEYVLVGIVEDIAVNGAKSYCVWEV